MLIAIMDLWLASKSHHTNYRYVVLYIPYIILSWISLKSTQQLGLLVSFVKEQEIPKEQKQRESCEMTKMKLPGISRFDISRVQYII